MKILILNVNIKVESILLDYWIFINIIYLYIFKQLYII